MLNEVSYSINIATCSLDDHRTGTEAGYSRHRYLKETPCGECREAHNAYVRERNALTGAGRKAAKKFREDNPDRVREQAARYWAKNPEKKLEKGARYRASHRAELSKASAKYNHQRRARKLGAPVGVAYTKQEIFKRDEWICQICSTPIDSTLTHPDRMSASVDHIVELYKGGPDCETNVRASHLTCNLSRSRS